MFHVVGTGSAQVGPLQEQIWESVQAQAGGQGADEAIKTTQGDAYGPADEQQNHQPDDAPQTRSKGGHPRLWGGKEDVTGRYFT